MNMNIIKYLFVFSLVVGDPKSSVSDNNFLNKISTINNKIEEKKPFKDQNDIYSIYIPDMALFVKYTYDKPLEFTQLDNIFSFVQLMCKHNYSKLTIYFLETLNRDEIFHQQKMMISIPEYINQLHKSSNHLEKRPLQTAVKITNNSKLIEAMKTINKENNTSVNGFFLVAEWDSTINDTVV